MAGIRLILVLRASGPLFRSIQMVVAGVSAWLVGLGASVFGLRDVPGIGVAALAMLLLVKRPEGLLSSAAT